MIKIYKEESIKLAISINEKTFHYRDKISYSENISAKAVIASSMTLLPR